MSNKNEDKGSGLADFLLPLLAFIIILYCIFKRHGKKYLNTN